MKEPPKRATIYKTKSTRMKKKLGESEESLTDK